MTRFAEHKLAELFTLELSIVLIGQLADVLGEHRLLRQLLCVVLFYVRDLGRIWQLCVVDHRLDIVFTLLHYVLVLQLGNVAILALNVSVEERALLLGVTVLESLVPAEPLELQVEVQDEQGVRKVDVGESSVIARPQVHR